MIPENRSQRVKLFPVLLVNFIGTLGFSIVLSLLVFVVLDLGGNALVDGIVGGTYPALQVVGRRSPAAGRIATGGVGSCCSAVKACQGTSAA